MLLISGQRGIALCLVVVLFLTLPITHVCAETTATTSSQISTTTSSSDSDDSNLQKRISLGLLVVIVGVFLWMGWQSDKDWLSKKTQNSPVLIATETPPCKLFVDLVPPNNTALTVAQSDQFELAARAGVSLAF